MALIFSVDAIDVPETFTFGRVPISTGFNKDWQIINRSRIWPSLTPYPPNTNSSWSPIAFHRQNHDFFLMFSGRFPFSQAWKTPGSAYRVTGTLGPVVIQSAPVNPPAVGDAVIAAGFTFTGATVPTVAAPFKCAGDWTWTITHIPPPSEYEFSSINVL
jgi:hypothetical protein